MKTETDIAILLAGLVGQALAPDEKERLARVVETNESLFAAIRDTLWNDGDQHSATKIDRLISGFHPSCQPHGPSA